MAKNRCDVCNKRINGINLISYEIEDATICSNCYEKIKGFKRLKKYTSLESIEEDQNNCISQLKEIEFPEEVIQSFTKHFETKKKELKIVEEMDSHLISTTATLEGYKIKEYLGLVSGQVVVGTGLFSSLDASYADLGGTEASVYTEKLAQARKVAQNRAIQESIKLGGNALVGVDIEQTSFTRDLISVTVNGTSVKVEKMM